MPDTNTHPDPQAGGQYVRNADGSLTRVGQTEEAASISEPALPAAGPALAPPSPDVVVDHPQE